MSSSSSFDLRTKVAFFPEETFCFLAFSTSLIVSSISFVSLGSFISSASFI